jgi:hypothetical protein
MKLQNENWIVNYFTFRLYLVAEKMNESQQLISVFLGAIIN